MKAYIFPGQGSQVKGMGEGLFEEFKELVKVADCELGYSIKNLCLDDIDGNLNNTKYTQPALFIVSALGYLKELRNGQKKPDFVAGHSIGEYAALFAAGVFNFETGIKLVKKRGELMAKVTGGKMAAIVGLKKEQVEQIVRNEKLDKIDIANLNTSNQIVISGAEDVIISAEKYFAGAEGFLKYRVLNVSGAFHSRYMEPVREEFFNFLSGFSYNRMSIPVISNVSAHVYNDEHVAATLSKQLVSPVNWTDSVRYMINKGVDTFEEIGPGHVTLRMIKKIQKEA